MDTIFGGRLDNREWFLSNEYLNEEYKEEPVLPLENRERLDISVNSKGNSDSQDALLPEIIANLPEYIWLAAMEKNNISILYTSPSINRLTGRSFDELREYQHLWISPETDPEGKNIQECIREIVSGRTTESKSRYPVRDKDGRQILLETCFKSHNVNGKPCCLCISRLFSERDEELHQLKQAVDDANAASKAKTEFLAAKSHDIRTPLSILIGNTELLRDTRLTKEQERYLNIMDKNAEVLISRLDDIMDISRIEAGKMELKRAPFNPASLIESISDMLSPDASKKSLAFLCRVDPNLPRYLTGDITRLRQVLLNLAENAVKFTEDGTVTLKVISVPPDNTEKHDKKRVKLQFSVSDTGTGIRKTDQEKIFNIFTQASERTPGKPQGSGMGLYISRALIEIMDGEIWLKSEYGRGTTFYFTVPLEYDHQTKNIPADISLKRHAKTEKATSEILLVDDNPESHLITKSILVKAGYTVDVISNGRDAIYAIQKRLYSLVIMDMDMPVMNGFDTTRKIRCLETFTGGRLPVIALSAYCLKEFQKKGYESGVDDYLVKPFKSESLLDRVEKWADTGKVFSDTLPARGNTGQEHLKKKFLVNRRADLQKIESFLKKGDYTEIGRVGHDMKGLGYAYGYHNISMAGEAIEEAALTDNGRKIVSQTEILAEILAGEGV